MIGVIPSVVRAEQDAANKLYLESIIAVFNLWFSQELRNDYNPAGLEKLRNGWMTAFVAGWREAENRRG